MLLIIILIYCNISAFYYSYKNYKILKGENVKHGK